MLSTVLIVIVLTMAAPMPGRLETEGVRAYLRKARGLSERDENMLAGRLGNSEQNRIVCSVLDDCWRKYGFEKLADSARKVLSPLTNATAGEERFSNDPDALFVAGMLYDHLCFKLVIGFKAVVDGERGLCAAWTNALWAGRDSANVLDNRATGLLYLLPPDAARDDALLRTAACETAMTEAANELTKTNQCVDSNPKLATEAKSVEMGRPNSHPRTCMTTKILLGLAARMSSSDSR